MDVFTYIEKNGKTFFRWGLTKNERVPGEGIVLGGGSFNTQAPYETWYESEQKRMERIELKKLLKKD